MKGLKCAIFKFAKNMSALCVPLGGRAGKQEAHFFLIFLSPLFVCLFAPCGSLGGRAREQEAHLPKLPLSSPLTLGHNPTNNQN